MSFPAGREDPDNLRTSALYVRSVIWGFQYPTLTEKMKTILMDGLHFWSECNYKVWRNCRIRTIINLSIQNSYRNFANGSFNVFENMIHMYTSYSVKINISFNHRRKQHYSCSILCNCKNKKMGKPYKDLPMVRVSLKDLAKPSKINGLQAMGKGFYLSD